MSNWKQFERDVAKQFSTQRMLRRGTSEKSDIEHPVFCVDCKLQKTWRIAEWFRSLKRAADRDSKIPLLVVREPRKHLKICVIELHVLVSLCKAAGLIESSDISTDRGTVEVGNYETPAFMDGSEYREA